VARNTTVPADLSAPPVTALLARFVSGHASRGWSDAVDHEAHRTFYNWLGCAIGAAQHEAAQAAVQAVQMLQPGRTGQRARPHRAGGHGQRRTHQRHHLAHLRL
jgi:2-methylcitrate dehydratase PrpD